MGPFFAYALTVAIYLLGGYLIYKIFLSGARQHEFNRLAIHLIMVLSLLMPFLNLIGTSPINQSSISDATFPATVGFELIPGGLVTGVNPPLWTVVLTYIYFGGMLATGIWMFLGVLKLRKLIRKGERIPVKVNGVWTIVTLLEDENVAPFSWMGHIVLSRADYETERDAILAHESGHVVHNHSFDMIFSMAMLAFQWFNPAAWLLVEELRGVHEYQADEEVMQSGVDLRQYQMLLIKKAVGKIYHTPANSLHHSSLKSRIGMMYKKRSAPVRRAWLLLVVPAMSVAAFVTKVPPVEKILTDCKDVRVMPSSESEEESKERLASWIKEKKSKFDEQVGDKIHNVTDVTAQFPGGAAGITRYLSSKVRYPESAMKQKVQGRVIVKFAVGKNGKIFDARILKGISDDLDAEALRIVKEMPEWEPALVDGKPVASYFTLPVTFRLPD